MSDVQQLELIRQFHILPGDALIDRKMAAAVIHLNEGTLAQHAVKGAGPKYIRIGRKALYRKSDLLAWIEETAR